MRLLTASFSILLLTATPASAEPVWGQIEFGMTRAAVEALHPESDDVEFQSSAIEISDVTITDRCQAEVNIRFDDAGLVREVMVAGNPSMGGRCSNDVLTALSGKYGQPHNWDSSEGSILSREGRVAIWTRQDGVVLRFKKFTNGIFGGGGLASASWELTYTPPQQISL